MPPQSGIPSLAQAAAAACACFFVRPFCCLPAAGDYMPGMSQPPDRPSPSKPRLSAEQQRVREADRLKSIRLRMAIGRELDDRGIIDPVKIGAALGMPAAEATSLLTRQQWREDDLPRLEAVAARLGGSGPGSRGEETRQGGRRLGGGP